MQAHAVFHHRFGLGVRPDDPAVDLSPDALQLRLAREASAPPASSSSTGGPSAVRTPAALAAWLAQQRAVRQAPEEQRSGIREAYLRESRQTYLLAVGARVDSALQTTTPFVERLVHFWSNHFAVSVDKLVVLGLAGAFEADAIRPHVLGRFEDLLQAAVSHPAMLLYLDQAQSVGPRSRVGLRTAERQPRPRGLNENLAREILELHTLGVRSGYSQDDVTELARALTGWTLPPDAPAQASAEGFAAPFRFVPAMHEPGPRTVLGRTYAEAGEAQARAILRDLVASPATARHLAFKLARHFVADDPPPALVQRLAQTFERTGGELTAVYRELVTAPEAWEAPPTKFKSPFDWLVSALRALGRTTLPPQQAANVLNQLGQPLWRPGSPAGYDDTAAAWAAPDALWRRVEVAQRLATLAGAPVDSRALAPRVLPGGVSRDTASALARADSGDTALALLLVSPEFLRR
jgi:uncharacterized protein (DUF1800 family)